MAWNPVQTTDSALEHRMVAAALRLIAGYGLSKLTLDDVAREAGCSRATLYRYYPGKQALLGAVVDSETARLRAGLDQALADVTALDQALTAAAAFGAREFGEHPALQFLLAHEPGSVLPHLCFSGAENLLRLVSGVVAPHLGRFLPSLQARRAAEWLARIVLSYGCTPPAGPSSPSTGAAPGEAAVIAVVKKFVAPAIASTEETHA